MNEPQAMTLDEHRNETDCATCNKPLGQLQVTRNRNGRLVHRLCPTRT